jgi:uncharacterized coiled-coil DUF342 family protein
LAPDLGNNDHEAAMDEFKVRKDGLLIPSDWIRGFGPSVSVTRSRDVLIIESPRRATARRRLAEQVRRLRLTARRLGSPTRREIAAEVSAVRARRASQRIGARSI